MSGLLAGYPAGTKPLFLAHSRGGLVVRSYMNCQSHGGNVLGLVTLGTPHHGSPLAIPDWTAFAWASQFGNSPASRDLFNLAEWLLFPFDDLGSLQLAWDNQDWANGGIITGNFDVSFAVNGQIEFTVQDTNRDFLNPSDDTVLLSLMYKSACGTLDELNNDEAYLDKIVAFAVYDSNLADNPDSWTPWANAVAAYVSCWIDGECDASVEHAGLNALTRLLAFVHTGVTPSHVVYYANDGMVPIQSALFLDLSEHRRSARAVVTSCRSMLLRLTAQRQMRAIHYSYTETICHCSIQITPVTGMT